MHQRQVRRLKPAPLRFGTVGEVSDWTIISLLEVDDSAAGRLDGLEVRMSRKQMESRDVGVSLFRYGPNVRNPMSHQHREQEEAYVIVSGFGRVRLDDEIKEVRQWDVIRVAPEVLRAFEAGPEGMDVVAVGGPKPEGGDGELSDSPWPDAAN
jgi:mannose-6-phosphate isomerase-like protein (cupin superfamily)